MADEPKKPLIEDRAGRAVPELPQDDVPEVRLPEGPLPGMPPASDPLLQPMPRPRDPERKFD